MPSRSLPKQAILVVNGASRVGRESFDKAAAALRERGVELVDAILLKDPSTCKQVVAEAVDRAPMVIVGGGDGTLSSTIDYFKDRETVFAILPLGTANSFARALGIPLDLEGAVDVIANGRCRKIDLGCINGDYFGNSAAIGLSPMIARTVPSKLKKSLGRVGYGLWAAKMAVGFRPFRVTIREGRSTATLWATEVRIANGGYFGGVELVEKAELDSGEMIVQIVTGRSSGNLAKSWFSTMLRLRHRDQWQAEIRSKKLRLETDPVMDVTIDGEIATRTPVLITVAPKAVAIAAPRETQP
jgi:YegS/Rv2252/BmrU family lipid kinase